MLWHLIMVAGLVPSCTCGTRGSWQSSGGEWPGSKEGVGVALSFLVEGQQRHVRCLDDLRNSKNPFRDSKNPPKLSKRPTKNSPRPQKDSPRPQKDPCLRECSGIYGPPSAWRGLGEHTSLSAFDWTGSHGIPFRGGALAPAGKPQPLFHAGSYLTSNSINVAKVVVKELQRSWEPRNRHREILPWHVRVGEGSRLVVDRDGPRGHADGMVVRWLVGGFVGFKDLITELKRNHNARL